MGLEVMVGTMLVMVWVMGGYKGDLRGKGDFGLEGVGW